MMMDSIREQCSFEAENGLILTETIFCDYEFDNAVLNMYFERFLNTIKSVAKQEVPSGFSHSYIIYISNDKQEYIKKIKLFINSIKIEKNTDVSLVLYEHPEDGYGADADSHIDKLKNPNKFPILRDELFKKSNFYDKKDYEVLIRLAIDDDDLVPSWHLKNIVEIARGVLRAKGTGVYGVGLLNGFVAYKTEDGMFDVDRVELTRAIAGNKFWVIPKGYNGERFSPWMLPDVIHNDNSELIYKNYGAHVFYYKNEIPGVAYMRWGGKNLSAFRKNHFYTEDLISYRKVKFDELADFTFYETKADCVFNVDEIVYPILDYRIKIFIRNKNEIAVRTNLNDFCPSGYNAFYLYRNGEVIEKTKYMKDGSYVFYVDDTAEDDFIVKAFLKNNRELVKTVKSRKAYR